MSDEHHCTTRCATRPRANLTLLLGRLWSPECLAARTQRQLDRTDRTEADGTRGGVHGLRVIPPRPRRVKG